MARSSILRAVGVLLIAAGGGAAVFTLGREPTQDRGRHASRLMSNDLALLRREALFMFPRGSPVDSAAEGLKDLGFRCAPARHLLANINAPSVQCESAGRGYPTVGRLQVTVIARNGMVSDIAIGNGFDPIQADAQTPDPGPADQVASIGKAASPVEDAVAGLSTEEGR